METQRIRSKQIKEAKAPYRVKRKAASPKRSPRKITLKWTDVEGATEPIVLKKDGEPVAVVVKYEDYRRLDAARAGHRQQTWRELEEMLAKVHSRTQDFSAEEVEADIAAARQEVRQQHHALRGRR